MTLIIEAGKSYRTRSGRVVRILCTDRKTDGPYRSARVVVGLILQPHGDEEYGGWTLNGSYSPTALADVLSPLDLIEEYTPPRQIKGWLAWYTYGPQYAILPQTWPSYSHEKPTQEQCGPTVRLVARKEITLTEGEGLG